MGNDKEALHSDNSRIENVPSLKNDHTNMGYTRDSDYLQLQHFDPEGKNVVHETAGVVIMKSFLIIAHVTVEKGNV
jgi:hypothetical protein